MPAVAGKEDIPIMNDPWEARVANEMQEDE